MRGPQWLRGKEPACQCRRVERLGFHPYPLEQGMATGSSIFARKILWPEGPGSYSQWGRKESGTAAHTGTRGVCAPGLSMCYSHANPGWEIPAWSKPKRRRTLFVVGVAIIAAAVVVEIVVVEPYICALQPLWVLNDLHYHLCSMKQQCKIIPI